MDITKPFVAWVVYSLIIITGKIMFISGWEWWLAVCGLVILPPAIAVGYCVFRFLDGLPK